MSETAIKIKNEINLNPPEITKLVWDTRYRRNDEKTIEESLSRVVNGILPEDYIHYKSIYDSILDRDLNPAGRIHSGAGTDYNVTLMNCFVLGTILDSLTGIYDTLFDGAKSQAAGGGIGTDFTPIRPEGAHVSRLNSYSSGPISFMYVWDSSCACIMSAGGRRGAMMGTLACWHPDIVKFIEVKQTKGVLINFNVSVLVTDKFMEAVKNDDEWDLFFNVRPHDKSKIVDSYVLDDENNMLHGKTVYVYERLKAKDIWDKIMQSTYEYAEPGVIFIDRINKTNNLNYVETISSTNPCAEEPLPPHGCCDLGAVNVANMVINPFGPNPLFDYNKFKKAIRNGVIFLDRVLDVTKYPLTDQLNESMNKRRIGLGITGLANMLMMMRMRYGSDEALDHVNRIMKIFANIAYQTSAQLAKKFGSFPLYDEEKILNSYFVSRLEESTKNEIKKNGLRNGVILTIAPTGSTSIYYNNISSGLEPVFAFEYNRNVRKDGTDVYETHKVEDYGINLYKRLKGIDDIKDVEEDWLVAAHDLSPEDHLKMQAVCQKYIDASISKTINCDPDISYEDFKAIYERAYELGNKGCTTYRPSGVRGSILSTIDDSSKKKSIEKGKRPNVLEGRTYKLKFGMKENIYLTINKDENDNLYEIFINTKNETDTPWLHVISRLLTIIFRTDNENNDLSYLAINELRETLGSNGAWVEGKYRNSLPSYMGDLLKEALEENKDVTEVKEDEVSDDGVCLDCD